MQIENKDDLIEAIRYECFKLKGYKHFAKKCGVADSMVSLVINGHREPTAAMIKEVGYKLSYVKVEL